MCAIEIDYRANGFLGWFCCLVVIVVSRKCNSLCICSLALTHSSPSPNTFPWILWKFFHVSMDISIRSIFNGDYLRWVLTDIFYVSIMQNSV